MSSFKPPPAASSSGDLPADALYEVLLRIPAKELCRLRAVCPYWRALTYDPHFVAAHKSRHHKAPPLLAVAYNYKDNGDDNGVVILDLSGNVVKRIPNTEYKALMMFDRIRVVGTRLDFICLSWVVCSRAFWVLNPATGATVALPLSFSEELEHELEEITGCCHFESCAFGQVSSTGEYKALRVSGINDRQVCEVITFDDTTHGCWRRKEDPPSRICARRQMRLDGVLYFLMDFYPTYCNTGVLTIEPGSIASFNLETEEWGVLPGPEQVQSFVQENDDYGYAELGLQLSLAELDGCLVMVQNIHYKSMDLWFLSDFEKGIWVKKYSMPSHVANFNRHIFLMLDDGTIFFSGSDGLQGLFSVGEQGDGFLLSYDPRNDTYGYALKLRDSKSIGVYTGSLLSL